MRLYRISDVLCSLVLAVASSSFLLVYRLPLWLLLIIPLYIAACILPGLLNPRRMGRRLRLCYHGSSTLAAAAAALLLALAWHGLLILGYFMGKLNIRLLIFSIIYAVVAFAMLIWGGAASVFLSSSQLGVKWRILMIALWWLPPVNLYLMIEIIRRTHREVYFELMRRERNAARAEERVCATRYPVLLVHGFFFRDWALFNYWGRIPDELRANGAQIYYGEQQSARPVADSAEELARRIRHIVEDTGCEKVNIIAHSKGGLDCRYALAHLGVAPMVASLTTVSTPHRGCLFADKLLEAVPEGVALKVAAAYNGSLRLLGDSNPDFLAAARDLTASASIPRDAELVPPEGVLCQSFGSHQVRAVSGRFPLNLSYHIVKRHDGPNDGLVALSSFAFGESCTILEPSGRRGISHGDMIDLSREDVPDFDVREFYVGIVSDLKRRGL